MTTDILLDRRIFQRIPVTTTAYFFSPKRKRWSVAKVQDISAAGLGLEVSNLAGELELDMPLELWLRIPQKDDLFYTAGSIAWLQRKNQQEFKFGVRLRKIDLPGMSQVLRAAKNKVDFEQNCPIEQPRPSSF